MALNAKNDPAIAAIDRCSTPNSVWEEVTSRLSHLHLTTDVIIEKSNQPIVLDGGNCDVYKGKLRIDDDTVLDVAIKRMRLNLFTNAGLGKTFGKEMYLWSKLNHENVAKLQGFYVENGYPSFLSKWAEEGTVDDYVKYHPNCDLLAIVLGIARGLAHLHQNKIIHSDLKSANILMCENETPKLIDFGASRKTEYTLQNLMSSPGIRRGTTIRYVAYELLSFFDEEDIDDAAEKDVRCTPESDMWSFGMVVYELISGKVPYYEIGLIKATAEFRVTKRIREKKLPTIPVNLSPLQQFLWEKICLPCWKHDPKERLSVADAILCLESSFQA